MKISASAINLIQLKASDWTAVRPLIRAFYKYFGYRFSDRTQGRAFRELLADKRIGDALLIRVEKEAVGYIVLTRGWSIEHGGSVALVDELFIASGFRNKGVGTRVLRLLRQHAGKMGIRRLFLEVESYNPRAKALYARTGYRDTKRTLMRMDTD